MAGDRVVELPCPERYDLAQTMTSTRLGPYDPSAELDGDAFWRATRTPDGAATYRVAKLEDRVRVDAWGPGSDWVERHAAALTGLLDDPSAFMPEHPLVRQLARRFAGAHLPRTLRVFERLVPTILQQLVTWREALRSIRLITAAHGEDAPGPRPLRLLPDAETLGHLPPYTFAPLGALAKHARAIRAAARVANKLESLADATYEDAANIMHAIPGIGPWTSALTLAMVQGHADAVPINDLHLPREVSWALVGEREADDARMLELLAPFAGHRWRVIKLLRAGGPKLPRRRPRKPMRPIR